MIWPFRPRPLLQPALAARLQKLACSPVEEQTLDDSWVVVDVETGGLNPGADPLLAIGAVTVSHSSIVRQLIRLGHQARWLDTGSA